MAGSGRRASWYIHTLLTTTALTSVAAFAPSSALADRLHTTDDAYITEGRPAANFGSSRVIIVGDRAVVDLRKNNDKDSDSDRDDPDDVDGHDDGRRIEGLARFDLTALPNGAAGAAVDKAILRLWVSKVRRAGSIAIHEAAGAWSEASVNWGNAPPLGRLIATVPISPADERNFLTVDLTDLVRDWLDAAASGGDINHGIVIAPGAPGTRVKFDSKENDKTSHAMEIEVVLAGNGNGAQPAPPDHRA